MITFFVPGIPVAKGSAKAFYNKHTGRAIVSQTNRERQRPWASMISVCAQNTGCQVYGGGVSLSLLFIMPRPKSHYGTGKNSQNLKMSAPTFHTSTPDLDKLIRCVKDALKGIVYKDDSQVCKMTEVVKAYGEAPGVQITVEEV